LFFLALVNVVGVTSIARHERKGSMQVDSIEETIAEQTTEDTTEATNSEAEEERRLRAVSREESGVRNRLEAFLNAQAQGWIDDATCIRYLRAILALFHSECDAKPNGQFQRWSAYDYWLGFEALAGLNEFLEPQDKLVFTVDEDRASDGSVGMRWFSRVYSPEDQKRFDAAIAEAE
jgi:hypothetical protein